MTDNITLPRATVQQALEALEAYKNFIDDAYINEGQWHWLNGLDNAQTALKAALEQQAEPVSELQKRYLESEKVFQQQAEPVYTAPPKRQPLTDGKISWLWSDAHNDTTDRMAFQVFARAIEAAHGIKEQP